MLASTDSSLVLASCTFAFSAARADLSLAFIIEYSAVRAFASAAQASLAESAQATETNPNPRPNTTLTAIDWLLVMAKSSTEARRADDAVTTGGIASRRSGWANRRGQDRSRVGAE